MPKQKPFSARVQGLAQEMPEADNFFAGQENMTQENVSAQPQAGAAGEEWFAEEDADAYEGQLAVDVYQDDKNMYVKTSIAGIKPEDLEVHLNNDMLTIRGKREMQEEVSEEQYFIRECFWGGFSRSIILPVDVKQDQVKANIENGVLTVTLPKSKRPRNTRIKVTEGR